MASHIAERAIEDALRTGRAVLKFISANDVGLTGGHQCGYYLPKPAWELYTPNAPDKGTNADSRPTVTWHDGRETKSRVIWYGKGTRSEYRLTRFGRDFPYLAADSVGDLLVLVPESHAVFRAYVLDLDEDIEEIQSALGVEIVGTAAWYVAGAGPEESPDECIERRFREFAGQHDEFPPTQAFSDATWAAIAACIRDFDRQIADDRLMRLVEEEYRLFQLVERQVCTREIVRPFKDVEDFLATAKGIINRRMSRAGRSLENHVEHLLRNANLQFDVRPPIAGEPDLLFPSRAAYEDDSFPIDRMRVVGVKRTCKDRWRQVTREAQRVPRKHILTLQPGISPAQLIEMRLANVSLIVPKSLHREYPKGTGVTIQTLEEFIDEVRLIQQAQPGGGLFNGPQA